MYVFWHLFLACSSKGTIDIPGINTEDTGEAQPAIEPDYSRWLGERSVEYDGCEGIVVEEGERLDTDWEHYELVESWCLECNGFYRVSVSPVSVCGLEVTQEVYRALWHEEDEAGVYLLDLEGDRWEIETLDEDGSFNGWDIRYDYTIQMWGEDAVVEGLISFPML